MDSSKHESVVAEAVEAFASELPAGKRRRELKTLARSLEHPAQEKSSRAQSRVTSDPAWTRAFGRGLELRDGETALTLWMNHASRESRIRSHQAQVWIYPLVLTGLVGVVMLFLGPMILEPFSRMYDEFGLQLPLPTRMLLYIGDHYLSEPIRALAMVAVAAALGYLLYWVINRYSPFSRFFHWLVSGNSVSVSAMASFTGMLSHLLSAGVPLADALQESGDACGHNYLASISKQLSDHVRERRGPLVNARAASRLPRNVIHAMEPKHNAAPSLTLLRELSSMYEERVAARYDWTGGAVGVFGVLVVGALVAFIILALFMPLVSLVSGLT